MPDRATRYRQLAARVRGVQRNLANTRTGIPDPSRVARHVIELADVVAELAEWAWTGRAPEAAAAEPGPGAAVDVDGRRFVHPQTRIPGLAPWIQIAGPPFRDGTDGSCFWSEIQALGTPEQVMRPLGTIDLAVIADVQTTQLIQSLEELLDDVDQVVDSPIHPNLVKVAAVRKILARFGGQPHRWPVTEGGPDGQ